MKLVTLLLCLLLAACAKENHAPTPPKASDLPYKEFDMGPGRLERVPRRPR